MNIHYVSERHDYINEAVEAAEELDREKEKRQKQKKEFEFVKIEVVDEPISKRRCILS